MRILVSGSAGFIGFHLLQEVNRKKFEVVGFDNMNNYYDINLKSNRIKELERIAKKNKVFFNFILGDLTNNSDLDEVFNNQEKYKLKNSKNNISYVINLLLKQVLDIL